MALNFNFPDTCWKYNKAQRKQSKRFLEHVEDSFLTQLVQEPARGGALLDLLFTNSEELVGDVKAGDWLGQSNQEIAEFSILGDVRRMTSKTAIFNCLGCLLQGSFGSDSLSLPKDLRLLRTP